MKVTETETIFGLLGSGLGLVEKKKLVYVCFSRIQLSELGLVFQFTLVGALSFSCLKSVQSPEKILLCQDGSILFKDP